MTVRLLTGDCLDVLPKLPDDSVDACVTDPPYGLVEPRSGMRGMQPRTDDQKAARRGGFMGKAWDASVPGIECWEAVSRVLKPGGWLVAFGGTRTHHRLMCAIEDAGFEILDCLMWLHGQGFPKGKNQLKPAWEPIILARKPLEGTVAANVLKWGTGGINVDACRIEGAPPSVPQPDLKSVNGRSTHLDANKRNGEMSNAAGRWPANVVLSHEPECREVGTKRVKTGNGGRGVARDTFGYHGNMGDREVVPYSVDGLETVPAWECAPECAVRLLDEQSGERPGGYRKHPSRTSEQGRNALGNFQDGYEHGERGYADQGGASRFFYCSKASTADRGPGNDHPTVKNTELMRWLITLVTPPGGTVLDPFCGSGSTLVAADRLGFDCIGIDSDSHAIEISRGRLEADAGMFAAVETS